MILITGASGLIGLALIKELYDQGERKLRVIINRNNYVKQLIFDEGLEDLSIEYVQGDIRDKESIRPAMFGVTQVYHLAALISIVPGDYHRLHEINVVGVQNIVELAIEHEVQKMVHVSSVEGFGYKKGELLVNESVGFRPDAYFIDYGRTKALGSIKALELAQAAALPLVIIAPAGVIGPHDYGFSRLGKLLWDTSCKKLPAYIDGSFDFVDSRDVARLCILAMRHSCAYETYICRAEHAKIEDLLQVVVEEKNIKLPPKVALPLAHIMASIFQWHYKFFGGNPLMTRGSLKLTQTQVSYDNHKAKTQLGWEYRPLAQTIKDTLFWYEQNRLTT